MGITDRDRNRLAALILLIRPAHSIAARVEALNEADRARYNRYSERMSAWIERCKAKHDDDIEIEARPYAHMLEGYDPPTMRGAKALFGEEPRILLIDTETDAARKWMDQLQ